MLSYLDVAITKAAAELDVADQAAQAVVDAGIYFIAAAGNGKEDACNRYPGRLPGVVAVGSTTLYDTRADTTNTGSCISIWAPGQNVISAGIANDLASKVKSGTSMATPVVVGALAIYLSAGKTLQDLMHDAETIAALQDQSTTGKFVSLEQILMIGSNIPAASTDESPTVSPQPRRLPILEVIAQNFNLQLLETHLAFGRLLGELSGQGPFTIFTPSDKAFQTLDNTWFRRFRNRSWSVHLRDVLFYHIHYGKIVVLNLDETQSLPMANGQSVTLTRTLGTSRVRVNDALVLAVYDATNGIALMTEEILFPSWINWSTLDVAASESVIFASLLVGNSYEALLRDPEETFTLFLPSSSALESIRTTLEEIRSQDLEDFVLCHVVPEIFPWAQLTPSRLLTVCGEFVEVLSTNPITIEVNAGQVGILTPDIPANNGIVHVIDGLLVAV